jgi:hypothetical protein
VSLLCATVGNLCILGVLWQSESLDRLNGLWRPGIGAVGLTKLSAVGAGRADLASAATPTLTTTVAGPAPWLARMRADWISSLVAERLRQTGQPRTASGLPAVSHRLHQTWKNEEPPHQLFSPQWRAALQTANPDCTYRLWTDAENRKLIADSYSWVRRRRVEPSCSL